MNSSVKKNVIYALASLCIIAGSEGYLRHRGYPPESPVSRETCSAVFDPELGWATSELKASSFPSKETNHGNRAVINICSDGSRVSRPSVRKITPYRVLLLGCSFTLGVGVEDYETFAWHLNDHYRDISFDNYAGGGYGTYQCYLLEKRLLDRYRNRHYDLVIYAAIGHHLLRNVAYAYWRDPDPTGNDQSARNNTPTLLNYAEIWYYPTAYLKADGSLGTNPACLRWPGDGVLSLINTIKHLYIFVHSNYLLRNDITDEFFEVYRLLLEEMNTCAQQHGAKFATIILENKEMHNADLAPKTDFPCVFVTDGREGKKEGPEFHVDDNLQYHPSPLVHENWAKHIASWMDEYICEAPPDKLKNSPDLEHAAQR